jgi:hypothetical protein
LIIRENGRRGSGKLDLPGVQIVRRVGGDDRLGVGEVSLRNV